MQESDPDDGLKVPAGHMVHTCPFAPVYPALHAHSCALRLACGLYELGGQLNSHPVSALVAPLTEPYFPAAHRAQCVAEEAPGNAPYVPAGHSWQDADDEAPWEAPHLPRAHGEQPAGPTAGLNVPGAHN